MSSENLKKKENKKGGTGRRQSRLLVIGEIRVLLDIDKHLLVRTNRASRAASGITPVADRVDFERSAIIPVVIHPGRFIAVDALYLSAPERR